ncbi:MAG: gliding motility lipoprotein GldJ [Bacteroidetes bacterium GWF2_41_31]|nr:MAG: gliding motility lipoprotein GldJ [Bacteroidetes bacterium GWF2_41_31]OFZ07732.1 MAG: gliding motility lipoprotein GldJ [Bacteroidetes bacterium RIFOXYB12_FULL_41_6]
MNKSFLILAGLAFLAIFSTSCKSRERSRTTGWEYNNPKNGGFEVAQSAEQITGPGLVLIEGGTFTMGSTSETPFYEWDNSPRKVTVSSFYIDQTEVSNIAYLEYIFWLNRVYGQSYPLVVQNALPDTLVWRDRLAYNEPLVQTYFRHPSYQNYPVVGVSWVQANDFASWRSDRVNEGLLIDAGILDFDPDQVDENNFNTDAYLAGQYEGLVKEGKKDLDPKGTGVRNVRFEDGLLLPNYRLPTEAEWEYAALGLVGNTLYNRVVERRQYPWNGSGVRTDETKYYGSFVANFKIGSGDYMGVAGNLNDGASIPASVGSYWPNDYGIYNMAGNVSEWVLDVYRPMTPEFVSDFNPYRGNVFQNVKKDIDGGIAPKDSLGRIVYENITPEEAASRKNYRKADNVNYRDGDYQSGIRADWLDGEEDAADSKSMYDYGQTTLISDKARVVKGGSWDDGVYYLSPGTRRFLNEDESASTIGFRCAMIRVGSAIPGGN